MSHGPTATLFYGIVVDVELLPWYAEESSCDDWWHENFPSDLCPYEDYVLVGDATSNYGPDEIGLLAVRGLKFKSDYCEQLPDQSFCVNSSKKEIEIFRAFCEKFNIPCELKWHLCAAYG